MKTTLLDLFTSSQLSEVKTFMDSTDLFANAKEIHIEHKGEIHILKINDQNVLELIPGSHKLH